MITQSGARPRSSGWFSILALLALLAALAPSARGVATAPHAQPDLLALARQRPDQQVDVIVQELARDSSLEQTVARWGGVVTADLHIIHAFAAKLPAVAALELARTAGVRWVSLDAPVVRATACTPCVGGTNLRNAYI